MAGEEGYFAGDELLDEWEAGAVEGGDFVDGIAGGGVDGFYLVVDFPKFVVVEVYFVEYEHCGDVIGFGGDEEAVDEAGGGAGETEGGDDAELVDVGGDDVGLLGELGGAADDVVAAVLDFGDEAGAVVVETKFDIVAYGDGVGLLVAANAEISAQTAVVFLLLEGGGGGIWRDKDFVPAACSAYDQTFHLFVVILLLGP